ncbi:MAG: cytochrome c [Cyclobacteriaceae bacterium]
MKNISTPISVFFCVILLISACGGNNQSGNQSESSNADNIKLKQYIVQGQRLYMTYCVACHQKEGTGLAQLYPPLANADYLMADQSRAACIIKNGLQGEIIVNGVSYNQVMIGNPNLTPLEVAEILTYISNSWGNDAGLINVKEVSKWLDNCDS